MRREDLTGKRFGRLIVVRQIESLNQQRRWECKCDCGKYKIVQTSRLNSGNVTSCGCLFTEQLIKRNTKHGLAHTKIYDVWRDMMTRCYNSKCEYYREYGARGIEICNEWHDVTIFYQWALSNGYKKGLTIDRIDVNGHYEPTNCRWATIMQQSNNKRNNRYITVNGITHTIAEWAKIYNLNFNTIVHRLKRNVPIEYLFIPSSNIRDWNKFKKPL